MTDVLDNLGVLGAAFLPLIIAVLVAVALERIRPWRGTWQRDGLGWLQVVVVYLVGVIFTRLIIPVSAVGAALYAENSGIGLFNWVDAPLWLTVPIAVLAIDIGDYLRHRLHHAAGLFWRMHRLHHADEMIDTATAIRFHPLEVLLTVAFAVAIVLVLGAPLEATIVHAGLVVVFDLWVHANIATPRWTRRLLPVFVTPELHRLHHSDEERFHGSNFGVIFSIWDRAFGTYAHPDMAPADMRFGLGKDSTLSYASLSSMLTDPVRSESVTRRKRGE